VSARFPAFVIIAGLIAAGLILQSFDEPPTPPARPVVEAGVAIPAARMDPSLTSTWYCAAGSTKDGGIGEHVLLIANPTNTARKAVITAVPGTIAPAPTAPKEAGASTTVPKTTTTTAPTTTLPEAPLVTKDVEVAAQSRLVVPMRELVPGAELVSAIVEADGGQIAVEHEITSARGRATAPCSTTASSDWSMPWGVTERGARELLVFFNPFPDDATVDITSATDEGVRDIGRFQGFVVPGRSVVGAYLDQDTRRSQVSAQITVRGGRLIVDEVQTFDGTDPREGITLGLGAPSVADVWVFPDGYVATGLQEQVIVFNPTEEVAEVDVEIRLDDPDTNGIPEPFELTVAPGRYSILNVHEEDRIPKDVGHAILVHSLNSVGIVAERVLVASEGSSRSGVSATLGSPIGAPTWFFPGGGTSAERDEYITIVNLSDEKVTFDVIALASGQTLAIQGLQGLELEPLARVSLRLGDHVIRDDLPVVVSADGPVVAERGLFRVGGGGISQSIGIPLADGVVIPDPINS
jgi:hypothetical protein